jgi:hypothetical protein
MTILFWMLTLAAVAAQPVPECVSYADEQADNCLGVIPDPCRSCDHQPSQQLCFDCCWRCAEDDCVVPCPGTNALHPPACDECLANAFMRCSLGQCRDKN